MDTATLAAALRDGDLDSLFELNSPDQVFTTTVDTGGETVVLRAARFGRANVWTDKDRQAATGHPSVQVHVHETEADAIECHNGWVRQTEGFARIMQRVGNDPRALMALAVAGAANGGLLTIEIAEQALDALDGHSPSTAPLPVAVPMAATGDLPRTGMYL